MRIVVTKTITRSATANTVKDTGSSSAISRGRPQGVATAEAATASPDGPSVRTSHIPARRSRGGSPPGRRPAAASRPGRRCTTLVPSRPPVRLWSAARTHTLADQALGPEPPVSRTAGADTEEGTTNSSLRPGRVRRAPARRAEVVRSPYLYGSAWLSYRGGRIRTRDLRFWRPPLYQLSYTPKRLG